MYCNMKTQFTFPAFPCIQKDSKRFQWAKKSSFSQDCWYTATPSLGQCPVCSCLPKHVSSLECCATSAYAIFLSSTSLQSSSFRINLLLATVNAHRNKTLTKWKPSLRDTYMQAFPIVWEVHQVHRTIRRKIIYPNHAFFL